MSEERRKNLRTQGRYGEGKVQRNNREKKQRSSLESKDSPEARLPKRSSDGNKSVNSSLADESASSLKYEENSDYSFHQLEEVAKPIEIKGKGEFILSKTAHGESRILYAPRFLYDNEANEYFELLYQTINFIARNIVIHGVEYPQPRLVAWFGPFPYSYSGVTLEAAEMPAAVLEIKEKVESYLKSLDITATFNSVLVNLYRDGKDSVSWHSDDEIMLGMSPTIASVSLGEVRKFEIRPKPEIKDHEDRSRSNSARQYVIHLAHGSLVVMTGSMQDDWQHRVPKEYHDKTRRINLTFRNIYPLEQVRHLVRKRRFSQRKSWPNNPRKKFRFDDFASPSSSYSRDDNKSYDEVHRSNYNLSIDSKHVSSAEKQYPHDLYASGRKTSTDSHRKRHEIKLFDDIDMFHETESSDFSKSPVAYKKHKKSRSTHLSSAITNENKSYVSTENEDYRSGRKSSTERHRKSHEIELPDDTDLVHETESSYFQKSPIAYETPKKSRSTHLHSVITTENKSYISTENEGYKSSKKIDTKRHRKKHEIGQSDDTDLIHGTESSDFQESLIAYKASKRSQSTHLHSVITTENQSYISTDNEGYKGGRKSHTEWYRKKREIKLLEDTDLIHETKTSNLQESPN